MNENIRIKDKMRSAYTPQQWLGVQIYKIIERRFTQINQIENWQKKESFYRGLGKYDWMDTEWKDYTPGENWGGDKKTAFFQTEISVPASFNEKYCVLNLKPGGEGVLKVNGVYTAGLDIKHDVVFLTDDAIEGEKYKLEIEVYCNEMEINAVVHRFPVSEICVLDRDIEDVFYDFQCLYDVMETPQSSSEVTAFLLLELRKAIMLIDFYETDLSVFKAGLLEAQKYLYLNVYNSNKFQIEGHLNMIGHSHLDLVYQWDYDEFLRKIGRTHSTVLNMMKEFPDYLFCQSQLKLYEDLKSFYPEIYESMKNRISEGRWEVIGGMYVEPDCNLISGESLIRQLQIGLGITKDEFNKSSTVCWLPDVFGNAWFIPQILKKVGIKYFITNKPVIWNDTNEFPHNTFWWEGPDGSRILTHLPATHFGTNINSDVMLMNWNEYKQKTVCEEAIYNYGYGDGRGGPNRKDVLTSRRYKKCPGMPKSELVHGEDAFKNIAKKVTNIPVWKDEIYLETHRGTYTTQARLKKNNRRSEILFRKAEAFSALASLDGSVYPSEKLLEGWKLILKNQFHDILPGSHIRKAYNDSIKDYDKIFEIGESVFNSAIKNLVPMKERSQTIAVFNTLVWERNDCVEFTVDATGIKNPIVVDLNGNEVPSQIIKTEEDEITLIAAVENIPSSGYKVYKVVEGRSEFTSPFTASETSIENKFFKIDFAEDGSISSIFDKYNKKELIIPKGRGNRFQMFEDVPGKYAAWDIVPTYKDKEFLIPAVEETKIIENGSVRLVLSQKRNFYKSRIEQRIVIYRNLPKIDFITDIDWTERDRLLKVGFPVEVNSMRAAYDISYGYIERPTHENTSWDAAKFEVSAHMWVDLSEGDYGVSLLNDCKYGYDISGNQMRLTLLKGSQFPDPEADLGHHSFTYSFFPHKGDWRTAETPKRAWELNSKLAAFSVSNTGETEKSYMHIDGDHVMFSALKVTEKGDGLLIRVYEDQNSRGSVTISLDRAILDAVECDLLENEIGKAEVKNGKLVFDIKPYEIKTFKLFRSNSCSSFENSVKIGIITETDPIAGLNNR
jgi:alpha-mannosidase